MHDGAKSRDGYSAKKGQAEPGYFWNLSAPGGSVVFQWQETRRHACLAELIGAD